MICTKCKNNGVLNTVMSKDFYYCRTCKEEILLLEVSEPKAKFNDSDLDLSEFNKAIADLIDWDMAD